MRLPDHELERQQKLRRTGRLGLSAIDTSCQPIRRRTANPRETTNPATSDPIRPMNPKNPPSVCLPGSFRKHPTTFRSGSQRKVNVTNSNQRKPNAPCAQSIQRFADHFWTKTDFFTNRSLQDQPLTTAKPGHLSQKPWNFEHHLWHVLPVRLVSLFANLRTRTNAN